MSVTIYHNPQCSKSRKTLEMLRERGPSPTVIEYLNTPPDAATLRELLSLLDLEPRGLMRTQEAVYGELNLADDTLDDDTLIAAMTAHPVLIERPIVVANGAAAIGRPPENINALFDA
ncbi:MAG: arsenate reductase (glutaredoxin) [Gammaproteobacteria bacterium]|jgi:arsenate reductase